MNAELNPSRKKPMINSLIEKIGAVEFPDLFFAHLYMHPIELNQKINLPEKFKNFNDLITKMLRSLPISKGKAFVTIDMKEIKCGETHRRGGAHVDGNYIFAWDSGGGNGWLTGVKGRLLSPENHKLQYCSSNGGMLIASSYKACKAWKGKYEGEARQGGDCSHISLRDEDSFLLEANTAYLGNSTCIHESLPIEADINRILVRITLPPVQIF